MAWATMEDRGKCGGSVMAGWQRALAGGPNLHLSSAKRADGDGRFGGGWPGSDRLERAGRCGPALAGG